MTAPAHPHRPAAAVLAALASLILLLSPCALPAQDTTARATAVKAALLPKIADFTTWPPADPATPITIGILSPDPEGIADQLQALINQGVTVQGRPLRLTRLPADTPAPLPATLNVLFIPAAAAPRWPALAPALRQRPLLTIADYPTFTTQGGMIAITTQSGAPAIAIRPETARQASVTLSSKLLALKKFVTILD